MVGLHRLRGVQLSHRRPRDASGRLLPGHAGRRVVRDAFRRPVVVLRGEGEDDELRPVLRLQRRRRRGGRELVAAVRVVSVRGLPVHVDDLRARAADLLCRASAVRLPLRARRIAALHERRHLVRGELLHGRLAGFALHVVEVRLQLVLGLHQLVALGVATGLLAGVARRPDGGEAPLDAALLLAVDLVDDTLRGRHEALATACLFAARTAAQPNDERRRKYQLRVRHEGHYTIVRGPRARRAASSRPSRRGCAACSASAGSGTSRARSTCNPG